MKNNYTFLELFGDIDEKFIYEASRPWKKQVIIKYRLLKTAVAGFILLFLAAGAMTHQEEVKAAWKQFTSWIGTALGLSEDVSSYTDVIGKTITRKGISVTIHEVAADKNDLWVAFSVTSDSEKTEEPVLLTDVLINKQEIQLSESYPVLLENGEMQGEVSHYTIEDNIFANGEADVTISVHTASPEEIQEELEEDEQAMMAEMRSLVWQDPAGYQAWEMMDLGTEDPEQSVAWFRERMQADFPALLADVPYTVSQVSPALEDTIQNPAFYMIPYLDKEGVENHIYINPKHMGDNVLPTLAHEGFPGHLYQTNFSRQTGDSLLCQLLEPTGYSEGWANYVENYCYRYLTENETAAQLCRINSQLSLNLYCQMDIGVNYLGWDTEELMDFAEAYFEVDTQAIEEMYQIFIASPGEYLQYYYTARQIEKAYDKASEALGSEFNDKDFHQAVLEALPTKEGIEKAVDAYIDANGGQQISSESAYKAAA